MPEPDTSPEGTLLHALTLLVAQWSSPQVQRSVAQRAGVGVDAPDISTLYVLGTHGPLRAGDLARAMRTSRPTISKQLARLERAGLLVREADPRDGRATVVGLSTEGAAAHRRLRRQGIAMMRHALRDRTRTDAAAFAADMADLLARLSDPGDAPGHTSDPGHTSSPGQIGDPADDPTRSRSGRTPEEDQS